MYPVVIQGRRRGFFASCHRYNRGVSSVSREDILADDIAKGAFQLTVTV